MMKQEIDVEAIIRWAYRDQMVDRMSGGITMSMGGNTSSSAMLADYARLGCRVSTGGRFRNERVHDDAEAIDQAVNDFAINPYIVKLNGRQGARPDWGDRLTKRYSYVPDHRGKITKRHGPSGKFCPVRVINSDDTIRVMRDEYLDWHRSLERVYQSYIDGAIILKAYHINAFAAPAAPWVS